MTHRPSAWLLIPTVALALLPLSPPVRAQAPRTGGGASGPGSDFSPAQQAKIQVRRAKFEKDVAALRADTKMTNAQKQARYRTLLQAADKDFLEILTSAQRTEALKQRGINAQFQRDVAALRADTKMTNAQKQARFRELVQAADQKTMATLTPAQRAIVLKRREAESAQQAVMQRRVEEIKRIGAQIEGSESPAQVAKIKAISQATKDQMRAVVANSALSQSVKMRKVEALRQEAQTKINAQLTPAQRAQFARLQALLPPPPH